MNDDEEFSSVILEENLEQQTKEEWFSGCQIEKAGNCIKIENS